MWSGAGCLRWMYVIQTTRFVEAHENISLSEEGAVVTVTTRDGFNFRTAAGPVLSGGTRHYAVFTMEHIVSAMFIGVVPDDCDVQGGQSVFNDDGSCFLRTIDGMRFPGVTKWPGLPAKYQIKRGERIGLLLDTAVGSLTVFLNDVLLGVMETSSLQGRRYRWAVSMHMQGTIVRIEPAPVPSRPTAEELAEAVARGEAARCAQEQAERAAAVAD